MVHLNGRQPLIVNRTFVTVPISDGAARVIQEFIQLHRASLDADLEPFGLTLNEIAVPIYERMVYADEVEGST